MKKKVVDPLLPERYGKMDAAELDAEVAMFDREFVIDQTRPMTAAERARELRARRRGRPPVGQGAQRVLVTIERDLLRESDERAKKLGLSRSALIARGLRAVLRKTG